MQPLMERYSWGDTVEGRGCGCHLLDMVLLLLQRTVAARTGASDPLTWN